MSEVTITLTLNLPEGVDAPEEAEAFNHFMADLLFDAAEAMDAFKVKADGATIVDANGREGRFTISRREASARDCGND